MPAKVGQVDELAQSYKNFGEQTENWQGVDVSVVARLQNGLTVQGGHEHRAQARGRLRRAGETAGARHRPDGVTNSSVTANVNALGGGAPLSVNNPYCRIEEPYRTDFRGSRRIRPESGRPARGDVGEHPRGLSRRTSWRTNAWIAAGPQPLGRLSPGPPTR